uniref:NYN domain-containing protein n=1 Tax=Brassica campestris TaxID=3711 RepID=A0A3P6AXZ3_BRACM|nr:unnamed protein product [Brassica rapa]
MAFSKNKTHSFIGSHRSNPRIPFLLFRSISVETMVVHGWTGVFWDMDEFPLPPGLDVDQFVKNVELAISNAGALGEVEFFAYSSSDSFDYGRYLESMSFTPAKVVGKRSRFYRLIHRMLNWVHKRQMYGGIKNLLVIAKAMPGEDNINLIKIIMFSQ